MIAYAKYSQSQVISEFDSDMTPCGVTIYFVK
jgi:hypothetical protein